MEEKITVVPATVTANDVHGIAPAPPRIKKEAGERTTVGERIFNYGVYGGFGWVLNEILSLAFTVTIYERDMKKAGPNAPLLSKIFNPNGLFYKPFEKTVDFLHKNVNPFKGPRRWFYLASEMTVMAGTGGNLVIIPIKWMEDRKGKIVRGIDRFLHGGKDSPELEAAHQRMDNEPKQSWGSLWKGRLAVLATAIGMHFVMGAENTAEHKRYIAPTTYLFQGTFMEKYSNLTRVMRTLTRDIFSLSWMPFIGKEQKEAMRAMRKAPGVPGMIEAEGRLAMQMGNTFGYILSVSAAMATLLFVSSRIFAAARDRRKEGKETARTSADTADITVNAPAQDATLADEQPKKEDIKGGKPTTTVGKASHELTLSPAPALEVSHAG